MSMRIFYPELDAAIRTLLAAGIAYLREHYRHQHFYAVGLGMVDDICGFFLVGNSLENLAQSVNEKGAKYRHFDHYWYISEWSGEEYTGLSNLVHDAVTALADPLDDDDDDEAYDQLRLDYQQHIINVLIDMRAQGQLRNAQGEELWVWLHYADAFDEDIDDVSFAQLHSPELSELFQCRYDKKQRNLSNVLQDKMRELGLLNH